MGSRTILVTGASGFVGQVLCSRLTQAGFAVHQAGRSAPADTTAHHHQVGDYTQEAAWASALPGIDVVIHLAARTHVLSDHGTDALDAYRAINVRGTTALARQAAACGVRRLIFMSSIKVNGESTLVRPFSENDAPAPEDAYGLSKWEAEQAVREVAARTGLETVILRPPLVYGPGVKGNFLRLLNAITHGLPLPFASINNQRSLIYLGNLVDAITACLDTPAAAGETFLLSDGEDVSTPQLIRKMATALNKSARLWPCPAALLNLGATLLGKRDTGLRLTGSLCADSTRIRQTLGWQPVFTLDQGLALTAQWYHRSQK